MKMNFDKNKSDKSDKKVYIELQNNRTTEPQNQQKDKQHEGKKNRRKTPIPKYPNNISAVTRKNRIIVKSLT